MRYTNCPAFPESFDPSQPVWHNKPVHHTGPGPMRDWPAACVWAQLDWERERNDGGLQFLENLETRWQELNLCSGCMRDLDHPFMLELDSLRKRAENAERKLAGIDQAARLPDQAFRLAVLDILERADDADQEA